MGKETQTTNFGVHYMLDGYASDPEFLKDLPKLKQILHEIPEAMDMHAICEPTVVEVGEKNRKDPGGVSGFVMIAESHISFHTFPKRGFITIDVYTCQDDLDTSKLTEEFINNFKLHDYDETVIKRGINYPTKNIY